MKQLLYILACISLPQTMHAQNVFKIQPGATVTVAGSTAITLHNMDLSNDGTLSTGNGTFVFTGNANTIIGGASVTDFNMILMGKAGQLSLQQDIRLGGGISFVTGNIDLNGQHILMEPFALLTNESANSRITGAAGGYVEIMADLIAPVNANPGNLGVVLSGTGNLGLTTIRRGHVSQKDGWGQGNSILRYYDVTPAQASTAQLQFNYLEPELNGLSEPLLSLFHSSNNTTWKNLGATALDPGTNWVQKASVTNFGRFTLSSNNNALPLTFLGFNVRCNNNEVYLQWKTAREINTSHFVIERSSNGLNYQGVGTVAAGGANYQFVDATPVYGQSFYRIVAYDVDGSRYYTGINHTSCNAVEGLKVWPNPARDQTWVTINTPIASGVSIQLFNNKGQQVHTLRNNLIPGSNQLPLNLSALPAGHYHGMATWQDGARRQSFSIVKGVN